MDKKLNYLLFWSQLQSWLSSESFEIEAGTVEVKGELSFFKPEVQKYSKNKLRWRQMNKKPQLES